MARERCVTLQPSMSPFSRGRPRAGCDSPPSSPRAPFPRGHPQGVPLHEGMGRTVLKYLECELPSPPEGSGAGGEGGSHVYRPSDSGRVVSLLIDSATEAALSASIIRISYDSLTVSRYFFWIFGSSSRNIMSKVRLGVRLAVR